MPYKDWTASKPSKCRDSFHDFSCRLIRTRQFSFLFHSFLVWRFCFLKTIVVLLFLSGLFIFAPVIVSSSSRAADSSALQEHHLRLYHTHTGEHIDIVYRRGDRYLPEAEEQLDRFLRDHRTGRSSTMILMFSTFFPISLPAVVRPDAEIDIICGYRNLSSNEFLRARLLNRPRTASTCRLTRLTSASQELTP